MGVDDYHVSREDMERVFIEQIHKETEERKKDRLLRLDRVSVVCEEGVSAR